MFVSVNKTLSEAKDIGTTGQTFLLQEKSPLVGFSFSIRHSSVGSEVGFRVLLGLHSAGLAEVSALFMPPVVSTDNRGLKHWLCGS